MADDLKLHLDAVSQWIEVNGDIPTPDPGLSAEERKQLHAVNKSIQQLTALGVKIPDDLRALKLRLSAQDNGSPANSEIESRLLTTELLIESLRELTQSARSLRDRLKATGQEHGTKRYYGVSLEDLLGSRHLTMEDRLELQWKKDGPTYEGKVCRDGSVMARMASGWKQFDSLSTAASALGGRALNGWEHWRRINQDGSRTPLTEIRAKFMNEGGVE